MSASYWKGYNYVHTKPAFKFWIVTSQCLNGWRSCGAGSRITLARRVWAWAGSHYSGLCHDKEPDQAVGIHRRVGWLRTTLGWDRAWARAGRVVLERHFSSTALRNASVAQKLDCRALLVTVMQCSVTCRCATTNMAEKVMSSVVISSGESHDK